jgi:hypothetical protein
VNPIRFTKFADVEFGTLGTIVIHGKGQDDKDLDISLDLTDIAKIVPRLMHAATAAIYTEPMIPPAGSPVPIGFPPIADGHAFAAKDTKEPCLTLHTCGVMFQFHFPSGIAEKCGKDLHAIAVAAAAPDPAARH